jgi:hypothetical protein
VSPEQSWSADTVAFGCPREPEASDSPPRRRPRGPRRRPSLSAPRLLAVVGLGIVSLVALLAVLGGGSDSPKAPIRTVADPVPRVVVKPPTLPRRREPQHHRKPALKRQPKGQLEEGKREPEKASVQPHQQAVPEPEPALPAEATPEPAPVEVVEPEPTSAPPMAPTSPAAEFGL